MEQWVQEMGPEALFPSNQALEAAKSSSTAPVIGGVDDALLTEAERQRRQQMMRRRRRRRRRQMARAAVEGLGQLPAPVHRGGGSGGGGSRGAAQRWLRRLRRGGEGLMAMGRGGPGHW